MTNALPFLVLAVMVSSCTTIHLDQSDGGYMNVLVGIDRSVNVDIDILNNLRVLFRKASQFLFEATRGNFYFKEVVISVPKNWPRTVQREMVWGTQFRDAQFQIIPGLRELGTLATKGSANTPVRIPPVFVARLNGTTTTIYGKPEYHLVHHWAIHRYKVYSENAEYPKKNLYCSANPVLFRKASQFLFEATRGKFYFKEVVISVPKNWPRTVQREMVWGTQFRDAQFQIIPGLRELGTLATMGSASNPVRIPAVFVARLNSTTTTIYGKPEYHLVHHWAIHRYKVYSENAEDTKKNLYCSPKPNGAEMKAVRCSDMISYNVTKGTGGVCPDMNSCSTSPYSCDVTYYQGPDRAAESVMFLPYLEGSPLMKHVALMSFEEGHA
ncbi:calcium-activated chloride channel regulator 1 [Ixodes scapularis]